MDQLARSWILHMHNDIICTYTDIVGWCMTHTVCLKSKYRTYYHQPYKVTDKNNSMGGTCSVVHVCIDCVKLKGRQAGYCCSLFMYAPPMLVLFWCVCLCFLVSSYYRMCKIYMSSYMCCKIEWLIKGLEPVWIIQESLTHVHVYT